MRYQTRVLPPEEWPKLQGTEAELLWPHLDPARAQIVVVERDETIVGCWVLMLVAHAECVWVAPDCRGAVSVARRLMRGLHEAARSMRVRSVVTSALSADVKRLIDHLDATPLPGAHFVFSIPEESCQQR